MNILLVAHRLYRDSKGGTEVLVEDTACEMKKRGHNVIIMAVGNLQNQKDFLIEKREDGIICITLSSFPQMHSIDQWINLQEVQSKKIGKVFKEISIKIDIIHIFHFMRIGLLFYKLSCFNKSTLIFSLTDYSLICPDYQLFDRKKGCICENYGDEKNCCICMNNLISKKDVKNWRDFNTKFINENAALVYCQTREQINILLNSGIRSRIISNHVTKYKTPQNWVQLHRKKEHRYDFAFFGRISPEKGLIIILEAFLNEEFKNSKLLICGDIDDIEYAKEIKKLIKNKKNISYLDAVSMNQLGELMLSVNNILFPSIWKENKSILIINACALGIPVLCSDVPSLKELPFKQLNFVKNYSFSWSWREAMKKTLDKHMVLPKYPDADNFISFQHEFYNYIDYLEKAYYENLKK